MKEVCSTIGDGLIVNDILKAKNNIRKKVLKQLTENMLFVLVP